ncbi:MAG TPA: hypothetical protein PKY50_16110 [Candidatus Competibacter sp.]|nr:hypothetical protein [Candidatus Competibacter sp.]
MFEQSRRSSNSSDVSAERPDRDGTRFAALWTRCTKGAPALAFAIYAKLAELYGEPHRRYHTLNHIRRCLDEFDRAVEWMDEPDAVETALWFHDAIYVPGAKDNEWRSAELFRQYADQCADRAFRQRVHDFIMATTHREQPSQPDARFVVDIDLASFGLPWDEFEHDGRDLRAECVGMTDDEYYPGQMRFLLALQNRPAFFFTSYFRQRYEQIARANMQRAIESLRARGYGKV